MGAVVEIVEPAAFQAREAAKYLGFDDPRWLEDAPIARCDVRKPGATRPTWVWRRADLDAFLAERRVAPGRPSPFG